MTTSSTISAANNTAATASQNIIKSLGVGSGVDTQSLAQNLVEAARAPQKSTIDARIARSEARISGYGAVSFVVSALKDRFAALDDLSDFNKFSINNNQASAFTALPSLRASEGNHLVTVSQLATGQRSLANVAISSSNDTLVSDLDLEFTLEGQQHTVFVAAGTSWSQAVQTINSTLSAQGIKASLINMGNAAADPSQPYRLVFSGPSGQGKDFTLQGLSLQDPPLQTAQDAIATVDGIEIRSASNTVRDAASGIDLQLNGLTTGTATLSLARDTAQLKSKLADLVAAYNDVETVLKEASNRESEVDVYGGKLVGDSTVNSIRSQLRKMVLPETTPGSTIKGLRDLGISIDKSGTMTLDESKLDSALANHFDDTVLMLSNGRSVPTLLKSYESGLAGNAVKGLTDMLGSGGLLSSQTTSAQKQIKAYNEQLSRLETRMSMLLERYNKQFAAMESLVSQTNSLKDSLKSSFEGMMAAYTQS